MKRLLLFFGLVFSFAMAHAQNAQQMTPQEQAHNQAMKMKKYLSLSDDQVTQVEQVLLDKIVAVNQIQSNTNETADQQKQEIDKAKADRDAKLATILTPDQYKKYQAARERNQQGDQGK